MGVLSEIEDLEMMLPSDYESSDSEAEEEGKAGSCPAGPERLASDRASLTVLVTDAGDFLASHVVRELLELPADVVVRVRAAVRSEDDGKLLQEALGADGRLEVVRFDGAVLQVDAVLRGVDVVIYNGPRHLGRTSSRRVRELDELACSYAIAAEQFMVACEDNRVRRVVVTSDATAVAHARPWGASLPLSERDWNNVADPRALVRKSEDPCSVWCTMAVERSCLRFGRDPTCKLQVYSIVPATLVGPNLLPRLAPSQQLCARILAQGAPVVGDYAFPVVDVRDAAKAHVLAMRCPTTKQQRFLLTGPRSVHLRERAEIARMALAEAAKDPALVARLRKRATRVLPPWKAKVRARMDASLSPAVQLMGKAPVFSTFDFKTSKAATVLGLGALVPTDESLRANALAAAKVLDVRLK